MKTVLIIIIIIIAIAAYYYFGFGSGPGKEAKKVEARPTVAPATGGGVIDALTGKTSVDQFHRARKKIDEVNKVRRKKFNKYKLGK